MQRTLNIRTMSINYGWNRFRELIIKGQNLQHIIVFLAKLNHACILYNSFCFKVATQALTFVIIP